MSLPQQVMMCLFSAYELMDVDKGYQKACIDIVKQRVRATVDGLGHTEPNPLFYRYYGLIDLDFWLRKHAGEDLVKWLKENVHPLDPVFRLAEDHRIVLLNGGGFEAPDWSIRVSFANLADDVYEDSGRAVRGYFQASQAFTDANSRSAAATQVEPAIKIRTESSRGAQLT